MNTGNFIYRKVSIPYTEAGEGLVVVLLHGFAETGDVWNEQVKFLQNEYRILVPEIPSSSWKEQVQQTDLSSLVSPLYKLPTMVDADPVEDSFWVALQIAADIGEMADALAAFIKSKTTEPVIVLGHSMGGYTTLALAEKYPELLRAFGLIHSTAFADTAEKKATRRKGIDFIRNNGATAFFKTAAPGLFSEQSKSRIPERLHQNVDMAANYHPEVLIANYEAMMARPNRTNVLADSQIPVLFIIGKEDKAAPVSDVLQQVHLPKIAYFHLLEKVAHMGMWEATVFVNQFIKQFLADSF